MHILEIIIEGFKSYSARTVVEKFDPQFNAITGLNGSGKSNILDAICFVLGMSQLANVRAEKLQELVYKQGNSGVTKATVTIVFDNTNKNQSPPGYTDFEKISVTRIIENQKSKYYINGKTETAEKVKSLFCSVKLNVNNPHFLIMQGRVTKVINMKPMEILGLIEEAAGISLYQTKKEQTLNTIKKKDLKLQEIQKILDEEVNPQLEQLRKDKEEYAIFKSNENQIEEGEKILIAFEFWESENFLKQADLKNKKFKEKKDKLEKELNQKTLEIEQLKVQIQNLQKNSNTTEAEKQIKEKISTAENIILENQLNLKRLQKEEEQFEDFKRNTINKIELLKQEVTKYSRKITEIESETLVQAEKEFESRKEQIRDLEKDLRSIKDGKENYQGAQESMNRAIQEAEGILSNAKNKKNSIQNEIKLLENKVREQEKYSNNREAEKMRYESDMSQLQKKIDKIQKDIEQRDYQMSEYGKMKEDSQQINRQLENLNKDLQQMQKVGDFYDFRYKLPSQHFDKKLVCGKVVSLIEVPDSQKYGQALEAAAGGKLMNVVVRNEKVSKELIQNKCLFYNATFIPLNQIRSETIKPEIIKRIMEVTQGKARLAKDLIKYDPQYEAAMNFVFGNVFVAEDEQTARKVAFGEFCNYMCVTLKGDKYNPQGVLEGGYKKNSDFLAQALQYKKLIDRKNDLTASKEKIQQNMNQLEKISNEVEQLKQQLSLIQHELATKEQRAKETQNESGLNDEERLKAMKEDLLDLNQKQQELIEKERIQFEKIIALRKDLTEFQQSGTGAKREKLFIDKIKQIQKERDDLQKQITKLKEQKMQYEIKNEDNKKDIQAMTEKIDHEEKSIKEEISKIKTMQQGISRAQIELEKFNQELNKHESDRNKANNDVSQLLQKQKNREDLSEKIQEEIKEIETSYKKFEHAKNSADKKIKDLLVQHKWIDVEHEFFGQPNHRYHFDSLDINKIAASQKTLRDENEVLRKRINLKVDAMFEKTEQQYVELQKKKEITYDNKNKFDDIIKELDELKNKEVEKTWRFVNESCTKIYSTLLPGASAKLEPPEGKTVHEGLELKVAFSGSWKDSLSELSGGQRSLLALSLILALLQYQPAPLYILDEIDSALDLSHTQNIGLMIRKFFKNSQFVIVSLKEGLFQNANVLFKVQFVDSRSTVKRFQVRKNQGELEAQQQKSNKKNQIQNENINQIIT